MGFLHIWYTNKIKQLCKTPKICYLNTLLPHLTIMVAMFSWGLIILIGAIDVIGVWHTFCIKNEDDCASPSFGICLMYYL